MAAEDYIDDDASRYWFSIIVDEWDKRDAERNKVRPTDFPDLTNEDEEEAEP